MAGSSNDSNEGITPVSYTYNGIPFTYHKVDDNPNPGQFLLMLRNKMTGAIVEVYEFVDEETRDATYDSALEKGSAVEQATYEIKKAFNSPTPGAVPNGINLCIVP